MLSLQLDNQLLDARNPVVLAPTRLALAGATAGKARPAAGNEPGSGAFAPLGTTSAPAGAATAQPSDAVITFHMVRSYGAAAQLDAASAGASASAEGGAAIVSFKKIEFEMDSLDLEVDSSFLEAVLTYSQVGCKTCGS